MKKLLLIVLFFSGCITHQKLAEKCLEKYPPLVEVIHDTLLLVDTINVSYESIDTFYLDTTIVIKEIQKIESTAKLELERRKFKKDFKRLYDQDLEIILDLNRTLDKVANDTTKANKEIRRLKEENQKLKQRLSTANKYKFGVWLFAVVLLFIAFLKWFKPRLF